MSANQEYYPNGVRKIAFIWQKASERDYMGELALWLSRQDLTHVQVRIANEGFEQQFSGGGLEINVNLFLLREWFPDYSLQDLFDEFSDLLERDLLSLHKRSPFFGHHSGLFYWNVGVEHLDELTPYIPYTPIKKREPQPDKSPCFIYVLYNGHHYKVGISNSIRKRIAQLQTASSLPIECVFRIDGPRHKISKIERRAHKRLASVNTSGEWFDCELSVITDVIEEIASEVLK